MPSDNSLANNPPKSTLISYNGYTFPEFRSVKHKIEPVYDSSGRVRTGNMYSFEIHFLLSAPDQATGAKNIPQIRCALTSPGGVLVIQGLGIGDMTINGSQATRQVADNGPKPQLLHFEPVGGVLAYEVIWQCEVLLVECCGTGGGSMFNAGQTGSTGQYIGDAWNNSIVYSIDDRGYTTRSVSGYIEIPVARQSGQPNAVSTTADAYRDMINIVLPFGFRRVRSDWRLSEDRRRLEFGVVDAEVEGDDFLPPGIVRGSFERSLSNRGDMNFNDWTYSLNATFERAVGSSRDWAYQQWFLLVATTVNTITQNIATSDPAATTGQSNTGAIIPERISLSWDCFTRVARMSTSFRICRSTADIILATGIWQPLNSDYESWAIAMNAYLWTNRGNATLYHDATSDAIIDPCNPASLTVKDLTRIYQLGSNATNPVLGCGSISPSTSWLKYQCWTEAEKKSYNVVQNPSQNYGAAAADDEEEDDGSDENETTDFSSDGATVGQYYQVKYQPIVRSRGAPITTVWLVGYATRVKFRPNAPVLKTYGGAECIEFFRELDGPRVVGSLAGCDIYAIRWRIHYHLAKVPTSDQPVYDQPRPQQNPLPGGSGS